MSDPREFVFRRGKHGELRFVGDFDSLYHAQSDPWGQAALYNNSMSQYYVYSRTQLLSSVQRRINSVSRELFNYGLEIGCGHGHVVDVLTHFTRMHWHGMDISDIAIEQAQKIFPKYKFMVGDIMKPCRFTEPGLYDIVVLGQILWYILYDMKKVMANCHNILTPGGLLIVSQAFLTKPQEYGNDIAVGFAGTLKLLLGFGGFELIEARYEDKLGLHHNDGIFVLRKV